MQTLAELKAQNAAEEEAALKAAEEAQARESAEDEEVEDESEGETQTETEEAGEREGEKPDSSEEEAEPWMQGDEGSPDAEKKFGDSDVAAAKRKLRAKLERQHQSREEELQRQIDDLKKSQSTPAVSEQLPPHPKRDDFNDHDDPDAAFTQALVEWNQKAAEEKAKAESKQQALIRQREEALSKVSSAVDQHYERAVSLAEKSGISPEAYQAADLKVRQAIDSVFNGAGDQVADALIANLGDGSEKVFYNLAVNSTRLTELTTRLKNDQSGLSAATFLGHLNAELKTPTKRNSSAPKPAPQISGDKKGSTDAKRLREKYRKASGQQAFELRREARRQGVDTREW
jgi:hypothetical protein